MLDWISLLMVAKVLVGFVLWDYLYIEEGGVHVALECCLIKSGKAVYASPFAAGFDLSDIVIVPEGQLNNLYTVQNIAKTFVLHT